MGWVYVIWLRTLGLLENALYGAAAAAAGHLHREKQVARKW